MELFGTNGVRGIINEELTTEVVSDLAKALGTFIGRGRVVTGRDTRKGGLMFQQAAMSALMSTGCDVIDIGLVPTPTLQYYVRNHADAGLIITASHNPRDYNGVKFIESDGTEFSRENEAEVRKIFENKNFTSVEWADIGSFSADSAIESYIEGILNLVDVERIKKRGFRVVADVGGGAAVVCMPDLLKRLGCDVTVMNETADGMFKGRQPEPVEGNIQELIGIMRKGGYDLGIANDGDADRVVFVDEKGEFVKEDVSLAICANYATKGHGGIVVTPVSTSQSVKDVVEANGGKIVWTSVGSMYVARKMMETGAVFGGEGNGGLIYPGFQYCRDAGMGAAKMLDLMSEGRTMSGMVAEISRYYNIKSKIKCIKKSEVMKYIADHVKDVDTTDGVKIWYEDGWMLIRPSGTEPIFRIYVEHKTKNGAEKISEDGLKLVNEAIDAVER